MTPLELFLAGGKKSSGKSIGRSLRLRGSSYLTRGNSAAGNRLKWSWSTWFKRGELGSLQVMLFGANTVTGGDQIRFETDDTLSFYDSVANTSLFNSTAVFQDPNAHYHVLVVYDSASAENNERIKIYVNGLRIQGTYGTIAANRNSYINAATTQSIGFNTVGTAAYFKGYVSEIQFIDGYAVLPIELASYSDETKQWTPDLYLGSRGANGFYLDFLDASSLANLGLDRSGNARNFTLNNVSLTAGITYDSMLDTPSNNHAIFNMIDTPLSAAFNSAGLGTVTVSGSKGIVYSSIAVKSGKWYAEFRSITAGNGDIGVISERGKLLKGAANGNVGSVPTGYSYWPTGQKFNNNVLATYGASYTATDVIGVALDMDAGTITFYKNGVSQGVAYSGLTGYMLFAFGYNGQAGGCVGYANFGQQPFSYNPPANHFPVCSFAMPTPAVKRGDSAFDIALYTGNGGHLQVGEYKYPRFNYLIAKGVKCRGITDSRFTRTFSVAGNRLKWTWAGWVRRATIGAVDQLFSAVSGANDLSLRFQATDKLALYDAATLTTYAETAKALKDTVDWHHIMLVYDSAQAGTSNRTKIYIDGELQTLSTATLGLNLQSAFNSAVSHGVAGAGSAVTGSELDGNIAEVYFIDGQALAPSDFGEWDTGNYYIPKAYTGTYGTTGFHLSFGDATSLVTLAYDSSGNSNNFTSRAGISLTAGNTYDSVTDTPTSNYATLNSLSIAGGSTITEAGSRFSVTTSSSVGRGTLAAKTGKWYFEYRCVTPGSSASNGHAIGIGVSNTHAVLYNVLTTPTIIKDGNTTAVAYGVAIAAGGIVGVALDIDNSTVEFFINGTSYGVVSFTSTAFTDKYYTPMFLGRGTGVGEGYVNFGQRPFSYTPPTGYKSWTKANVAELTYDLETPDIAWIKCRSNASNNMIFTSKQGVGQYVNTDSSNAMVYDAESLKEFNKNGFYLGNNADVNILNNTYIARMWKVGANVASNTDGTIPVSLTANPKYGISLGTYTGNGVAGASIGHGLGVTPSFIMIKNLTAGTTHWAVYHPDMWTTPEQRYMRFDTQGGPFIDATVWNNTQPSATRITLGNSTEVNGASNLYELIAFAEVDGFFKAGVYTGNNSADGPFCYTGFKIRSLIVKNTEPGNTGQWRTADSERDPNNPNRGSLSADNTSAESNVTGINLLSNGFKITSAAGQNGSGWNYIWIAIGETPFKYATAF